MAKIVLGMGTSHSPQLSAPVDQWQAKGIDDRNTLAGAMHDLPTRMELIDYVPRYRSIAGTGCGCAFAQWIVTT